MKPEQFLRADANDEIPALIETLLATERRLEELTGGEVDTVAGRDGRTFLLRRAQEQLRYSEAGKQAAILNALPAHIALLDTQGVIISVNESWRRFANANVFHSPGHGVGLNYVEICDQARGHFSSDPHAVAAGIRAVLGGKEKSFSIEYPCHSPTEHRWFQLIVTPLGDDRPNGAVVMHLNITARKLVAESLEKLSEKTERRERILNSALSSMSDFAQIYNREGRLLFVNQPLLNLWGLTLEAVVGKNFSDLGYPDELAAKLQRQVQEVFETKRIITDETVYFSPTGIRGWYEYIFSPIFAADGAVELVVGSTRDVTERKRAEEALRASEERLRAALSASCTGTFRWDIRTSELSWDESLEALFGIPEGKAIRSLENFVATVHPDDRSGVIERCERCAQTGADFEMEFRILWPDGSLHWLHDRGKTFLDTAGRPLYMTGACVDITERKQAGEALRASEAEFRALAEAMPQMVWITRPDGWNIYFSKQWMDYTGLTLEQSLGHGWLTPIHPEDQQRAWDDWHHAVATTGTYSIECRLRRADGIYRWWLVRGVPQQDATGNILKWFGTCTDIHDLKLAEQELRESEDRFSGAFLHAPIGVALVSPEGRWLQVNRVFCDLLGYSEAELLARTFQDITHPEDLNTNLDHMRELIAGGIHSYQMEKRYIDARGHFVPVLLNVSLVRDGQGQPRYFIAQVQDITEQKRGSALLMKSERRLALATESAGIGIWDWDMVTNQLIWDDQMYALYGIREQDFSGAYDAWQKGLHPEDRERAEADINAAAHGADGFHLEFRVLWPNGEVHHIEAHALVQRADDSSTAHMIGVNWDITERRQAEESRKRAEVRVEALHKQLLDASRRAGMAEVATGVLHNVGNVLNSVNVSTSLVVGRLRNSSVSRLMEVVKVMSDHAADLADFLTLDERGRKVPEFLGQLALHLNRETDEITAEMQAVAENVDHIKEIVNTQQCYAGTFGILEPLDLRESIDDALRIHAGALGRHNIEIVRNLEPVAAVVVDKHKVLQILVNLIGNAKQAMIDSPVKTLTIKTYSSSDGGSQLSIADTGCGILAENITRIFAHGFTTKKDGHGFGLHSSALAAREMNAVLIAHSDGVGHGAVFTLVFPPALPGRIAA